jgi:hypothetical protein
MDLLSPRICNYKNNKNLTCAERYRIWLTFLHMPAHVYTAQDPVLNTFITFQNNSKGKVHEIFDMGVFMKVHEIFDIRVFHEGSRNFRYRDFSCITSVFKNGFEKSRTKSALGPSDQRKNLKVLSKDIFICGEIIQ